MSVEGTPLGMRWSLAEGRGGWGQVSLIELEDAVGKSITFRPEVSYPIDVVHYRFLTGDGQEARIAIPAGLGVKA